MGRMIDQIRAGGKLAAPPFVASRLENDWAKTARRVVDLLGDPQLPVLVIDNVSDYYYQGTDQEFWDLRRDFPNLAPPYPMFWCEHRLARKIRSAEKGDTDVTDIIGPNARVGVLITAVDPKDAVIENAPPNIQKNARWYLWCELFISYDMGRDRDLKVIAQGPHGSIFLAVDEHGVLLEKPWIQTFVAAEDRAATEIIQCYVTWLHPTFLAVSFLHCKNVKIEDHAMDKPLAKKFRAKYGGEPARWKTLIIEPLKQILQQEGRAGAVGLAKAMHICRGHFRDYREGRGLFGRYHGVFWTPSVVRGTKGQAQPREVEIKVFKR